MKEVCNKVDCPLYNCYFEPINYKPFKKALDDYERNSTINSYKKDVVNWIEQSAVRIRTTCLACMYFNKIDIYELLLVEETKDLLIK